MLLWAIERILRPEGWVLESKLGGHNSYWLHKDGSKREFHFRWWTSQPDVVQVQDRYYLGKIIGKLKTEGDVLRFAVAVSKGKKWP